MNQFTIFISFFFFFSLNTCSPKAFFKESLWLSQFHACPSSPQHLSGICHLVSPGGGEFVRKPLPGGGAFVNSSRSDYSIFHLKIYLFRQLQILIKIVFLIIMLKRDMCGFCTITSLSHSIFLHRSKYYLLPSIVISSHMEEKQSMDRLRSLKEKTLSLCVNG